MSINHPSTINMTESQIKLYKRRWLNMILFVLYTVIGGIQWLQFSIIKDVIVKYYNVSPYAVEWTTFVFMLSNSFLTLPSIYLLNKFGIRYTIIIANAGVCIGAWIKLFSVDQDKFSLVLIGQSFEGIFTVLTFSLAARFTAIWFGSHEISFAGAMALFGDQLGSALTFLVPTLMVQNSEDMNVITEGLRNMHTVIAIMSTVILILMILLFKAKPTHPPSISQNLQRKMKKENVGKSLIKILLNPSFRLFVISYALCLGTCNAVWTMLNEVVLINFPDNNKDAGIIGFIVMFIGIIVSPTYGYILDKTKKYKQSAIQLTVGTLISVTLFSVALKLHNIIYVYITSFFIGKPKEKFPTLMVQNCEDMSVITKGLRNMHTVIAIMSTVILILMILLFKAKPTHPPSISQNLQRKMKKENVGKSLIKILLNPSFRLFVISYALCLGTCNAVWTMLNEVVLINFPLLQPFSPSIQDFKSVGSHAVV
ncbi:hypothetical protein PGB90_008486 [Kerria lacca]